jgi:hypothetical protein
MEANICDMVMRIKKQKWKVIKTSQRIWKHTKDMIIVIFEISFYWREITTEFEDCTSSEPVRLFESESKHGRSSNLCWPFPGASSNERKPKNAFGTAQRGYLWIRNNHRIQLKMRHILNLSFTSNFAEILTQVNKYLIERIESIDIHKCWNRTVCQGT